MLYAYLFKISTLLLQQNIATKEVAIAKVTKEYSKSANALHCNDGIIDYIAYLLESLHIYSSVHCNG